MYRGDETDIDANAVFIEKLEKELKEKDFQLKLLDNDWIVRKSLAFRVFKINEEPAKLLSNNSDIQQGDKIKIEFKFFNEGRLELFFNDRNKDIKHDFNIDEDISFEITVFAPEDLGNKYKITIDPKKEGKYNFELNLVY